MTDKVHIGPLTFDGEGLSDWVYSKLKGWYSSAPMRVDVEDRPNGEGAFGSVKNFRGARVLTFEGAVAAESFEQAETDFWDAWAGVQSDGVPFELSVETDNGIRSCIVTLSGSAEVDEDGSDPNVAKITAQFIAYDPVKYGPVRSLSTGLPMSGGGLEYPLASPSRALFYGAVGSLGRIEASNAGTAETWPVFTITGQLDSGFFIQCLETGQVLRYERVVPVGSTVTLDSRTGEVLIDGVSDGSTYLVRDEWFAIPSKTTRTIQFNSIGSASGGPTMTAAVRDGFW